MRRFSWFKKKKKKKKSNQNRKKKKKTTRNVQNHVGGFLYMIQSFESNKMIEE
jgi:hypothetical protein